MPSEEDLTGVKWNDATWLSYFPLNEATALDYFAQSQFYDRGCNNELIKMQRLDPALMSTMEGVEYLLVSHSTDLFVISKSRRALTPKPSVSLLAIYYILHGNVYQAPSVHAVLSSRIQQSIHHLRTAFDAMQKRAVVLPPSAYKSRRHWNPPPTPADAAVVAVEGDLEMMADAGAHERKSVDRILYDIMEKNKRISAAVAKPAANDAGAARVGATSVADQ